LGQHNALVLGELLGVSEEVRERLTSANIIGEYPTGFEPLAVGHMEA